MARRSYARRSAAPRRPYRGRVASQRSRSNRRAPSRAGSGGRGGQTLRIVVQTAPAPQVLGQTGTVVRDDRAKF